MQALLKYLLNYVGTPLSQSNHLYVTGKPVDKQIILFAYRCLPKYI